MPPKRLLMKLRSLNSFLLLMLHFRPYTALEVQRGSRCWNSTQKSQPKFYLNTTGENEPKHSSWNSADVPLPKFHLTANDESCFMFHYWRFTQASSIIKLHQNAGASILLLIIVSICWKVSPERLSLSIGQVRRMNFYVGAVAELIPKWWW